MNENNNKKIGSQPKLPESFNNLPEDTQEKLNKLAINWQEKLDKILQHLKYWNQKAD